MRRLHPGLLVVLGVCCTMPLRAGEPSRTRRFDITVWTTSDGLPENTVATIAQSPSGYLWLGTPDCGLVRFNGLRFRGFGPEASPGIDSLRVYRILRGRDGTLWISMMSGAIVALRDGRFAAESPPGKMADHWLKDLIFEDDTTCCFTTFGNSILRRTATAEGVCWETIEIPGCHAGSHCAADGAGTILCAVGDGRVQRVVGNAVVTLPAAATHEVGVVAMLVRDGEGRLWAGCSKGIARWTGEGFIPHELPPGQDDPGVFGILPAADGGAWVRFFDCIRRREPAGWGAVVRPDGPNTTRPDPMNEMMVEDGEGGVWVARPGIGLWHVQPDGSQSLLTAADGLPNQQPLCLNRDAEGNIWAGFLEGGLVRIRRRLFEIAAQEDAHGPPPQTHSICVDRSGAIWLAGAGGSLWQRTDDGWIDRSDPVEARGPLAVVTPASGGGIWLAVQAAGLYRVDEKKGLRRVLPAERFEQVARVLLEDASGALWIGNERGLWRLVGDELKRYSASDGFASVVMDESGHEEEPFVEAIVDDGAGGLWIGLAQGELRHMDATGAFAAHRPAQGNRWIRFWALHPDRDGAVWIGTLGSGLLHFRSGTFRRLTAAGGLPNDTVSQILDDGQGGLWIGTHGGIASADRNAIESVLAGRDRQVAFRRLGVSAGLPASQCSSGLQPLCGRDAVGRLWFSTNGGVVSTWPHAWVVRRPPTPVVIEEFRIASRDLLEAWADVPAEGSPTFELESRDRSVQIAFAGLSLADAADVRYRWRMEGVEHDWVDGATDRRAFYTLLQPGRHVFHVTAATTDGIWNETGARIAFTIDPYFWETTVFQVAVPAVGAAALMALGLIVQRRRQRQRIERLEQQTAVERERSRIARDLHDDLGTSLTQIDLLGALAERSQPASREAGDYIQELRGTARMMVASLDEIVWAITPRNDTFESLCAYLGTFAETFFKSSTIRCRLDLRPTPADLPLRTDVRHAVFLAFKEVLNNVARHSDAHECRVHTEFAGGMITIRVEDDGLGCDVGRAVANGGNGLGNIAARMADVGGSHRFRSAPGRGMSVVLEIKVA